MRGRAEDRTAWLIEPVPLVMEADVMANQRYGKIVRFACVMRLLGRFSILRSVGARRGFDGAERL
jgi:hypothetical protein